MKRINIEKQLGRGGMGMVYAARDPDLARDVAVKLLRPDRTSCTQVHAVFDNNSVNSCLLTRQHHCYGCAGYMICVTSKQTQRIFGEFCLERSRCFASYVHLVPEKAGA